MLEIQARTFTAGTWLCIRLWYVWNNTWH